jgi:ABC-type glycerol-3-phosphate transport system permease component
LIDGASYPRIFWSIIVPLCKPVLATATVIVFIAAWNDFVNPLIYLDERIKFTVAVGLDSLKGLEGFDAAGQITFHLLMAACTMAIAPTIVLFLSAQRYFVRGIVMSGIKG